jgi:hypothetical protein
MADNPGIAQIVDNIFVRLEESLVHSQEEKNQADIEKIINDCFNTEFEKFTDGIQNNQLYLKLSEHFHPDRFKTSHVDLFNYLNAKQLAYALQKALYQYKNITDFNTLVSDPLNGGVNLSISIMERFRDMGIEYKRYNQPIRALVNIISKLIAMVIFVGVFVLFLPLILASRVFFILIDNLNDWLINLVTRQQYAIATDDYINDSETKIEIKNQLILVLRDDMKEINPELTDAEFMNQLHQQKLDEKRLKLGTEQVSEEQLAKFNREITKELIGTVIPIIGFTKLTLVAKAIYHSVTRPLPNGAGNVLLSLTSRPLQIFAGIALLGFNSLVELSRFSIGSTSVGVFAIAALLKIASLALLNAPLYALDAYRYGREALRKCGMSDSKNTAQPAQQSKGSSSHTFLLTQLGEKRDSAGVELTDNAIYSCGNGRGIFAEIDKSSGAAVIISDENEDECVFDENSSLKASPGEAFI